MKKVSFRVRSFEKEQFLTYNIDNEATLDEDVLDFLEDEEPKGLVPIIFDEEEEYDTFSYDITGKICLSELSKQEINAEMVLKVMRGLVLALMDMGEYRVPLSYLVLNRNYIYVNSDYEVEFICIPLEEMQEEVDVNGFLRNFVASLRFESSENGDYVARILTYINNTAIFNLRNMVTLVEDLMDVCGVEIPEDASTDIYVEYQEVEEDGIIAEESDTEQAAGVEELDWESIIEEAEAAEEDVEEATVEEIVMEEESVEEEAAAAEEVGEEAPAEEEAIVETVAEEEAAVEEKPVEEEVAVAEEAPGEEEAAVAEEVAEEEPAEEEAAVAEEVAEEEPAEEKAAVAEEVAEEAPGEEEAVVEAVEEEPAEEEAAVAEEVAEEAPGEEEAAVAEEVAEEAPGEEEAAVAEEVAEEAPGEEEAAVAEEVAEEEPAEEEAIVEAVEEAPAEEEVIAEAVAEEEPAEEEAAEEVEKEEKAVTAGTIDVVAVAEETPEEKTAKTEEPSTSEVDSDDDLDDIPAFVEEDIVDKKVTDETTEKPEEVVPAVEEVQEVPKTPKKPRLKTKEVPDRAVVIEDELDEFLAEMERNDRKIKHEQTGLKIKKEIKVNRASIVKSNQEELKEAEEVVETPVEEKVEPAQSQAAPKKTADIPKVNPYLIRVNTEERVMITKQNFKLGKASMGVDYTIKGNGAVSRVHAIITNKDDIYYIKDNKSTNHTIVNGKTLEEGELEALLDDCNIVLGNEEFIFKLG